VGDCWRAEGQDSSRKRGYRNLGETGRPGGVDQEYIHVQRVGGAEIVKVDMYSVWISDCLLNNVFELSRRGHVPQLPPSTTVCPARPCDLILNKRVGRHGPVTSEFEQVQVVYLKDSFHNSFIDSLALE